MIKLYSTLERSKVEFLPINPGKVGMYVCGPTTYNYIHLGNARPIVVFDTVRKYFEYSGYEVNYVQNFTDIDDKIINSAKREKKDPLELSAYYIQAYFEDVMKLKVKKATNHPKVSDNIPEIIVLVAKLIKNGHAYAVNGDVYFNVRSYKPYGKLSGRDLDDLQAGARVEVGDIKQNPLDFALWKNAKAGEPSWDSPWGKGRPGWHIECSAMSEKFLGLPFDIHGGGSDLIFPHHENEIAQSEASCDCSFAKYWMHNGFITINEEKMSKSLNNFFLLREILSEYDGDVIRAFLLSTHYRNPLDFNKQKLGEYQRSLKRIYNTFANITAKKSQAIEDSADQTAMLAKIKSYRNGMEEAMNDDFNTALTIANIFDFCREINSYISAAKHNVDKAVLIDAEKLLTDFSVDILGIVDLEKTEEFDDNTLASVMEILLEVREEVRKAKNYTLADLIRNKLMSIGITVDDTPEGARWKK